MANDMTHRALTSVPEVAPRAVLYGRVSATMGRGDDLTSPELQEHQVRAYCQARGYEPVEWLCDVDRTGKSWSRRQVEHAVQLIEAGRADLIVVPRWSRFTRNLRDYVVQTARIEAAGGRLESALEETDPATAAGLLQRDLFAILAQWESRVKGEQWRETHQRRWRAGLPHSMSPRLGYHIIDGRHIPDPAEAPLVAETYRRYNAGAGIHQLANWLAREGLKSKTSGQPWVFTSLVRAMDSGFPAGLLRVAGSYLPGAHEPIIPPAVWDLYLVNRRARANTPPRHVQATTALAGLVRCGACGLSMQSRNGGGNLPDPRGYMYQCVNQRCTFRASVVRARVEATVKAWIRDVATDTSVRAVQQVAEAAARAVKASDRDLLLSKLTDIEERIDRVDELLIAKVFTIERRNRHVATLETQRADLTRQLEEIAVYEPAPVPNSEELLWLLDMWDRLPVHELNRLLRKIVGQVRVVRSLIRGLASNVQVTGQWEGASR